METAVETKTEAAMPKIREKEVIPVNNSKTDANSQKEGKETAPAEISKPASETPAVADTRVDKEGEPGGDQQEEVSGDGGNSSDDRLSDTAKEATPEVSSEPAEASESTQPQGKGKTSESPTKPKSKKKEDKSIGKRSLF